MKTLRSLKITSFLNGIYCFCCVLFAVSLVILQHRSIGAVRVLSTVGAFGWLLNPTPLVTFIVNLVLFLTERQDPQARQKIGRKSVWIFLWPVITTVFYFIAMGFLVEITGGV